MSYVENFVMNIYIIIYIYIIHTFTALLVDCEGSPMYDDVFIFIYLYPFLYFNKVAIYLFYKKIIH